MWISMPTNFGFLFFCNIDRSSDKRAAIGILLTLVDNILIAVYSFSNFLIAVSKCTTAVATLNAKITLCHPFMLFTF